MKKSLNTKVSAKKIALCALFSAMALIAFTIESLIPPIVIPGAKIGVSNIFILLATICLGYPYGIAVLIVKVTLGSVFAGNISSIMYSLPAGALALTCEILLLYFAKKVSVIAVSVAGSVINITAQNVVFCLVTKTSAYLCYLPYLALIGVVSGIAVGFAVYLCVKLMPNSAFTLSANTHNKTEE